MSITIATSFLHNQSILENIALVEEIDEQAAEIISGGQFANLLSKEVYALDDGNEEPKLYDPNNPNNPNNPNKPEEREDSEEPNQPVQQANFGFGDNRISRRRYGFRGRNSNRNRYC
ncbi:hypothetical protein [Sphaerospermopsis torques-reginae]|uniref:Uncharacterized protein n=1 Tax=Sphaerospermopsis torques-reginae ITEP-024 TaxID=984208 RepID=A0ABX8X062_9CYAN|nr:hypothetical protein [Sphaerospermopsis torques-reginae]QYX32030.1 hypothetical protein K2F26_00895 [Sphaerospermopsis torques-reginae ITEP-024]